MLKSAAGCSAHMQATGHGGHGNKKRQKQSREGGGGAPSQGDWLNSSLAELDRRFGKCTCRNELQALGDGRRFGKCTGCQRWEQADAGKMLQSPPPESAASFWKVRCSRLQPDSSVAAPAARVPAAPAVTRKDQPAATAVADSESDSESNSESETAAQGSQQWGEGTTRNTDGAGSESDSESDSEGNVELARKYGSGELNAESKWTRWSHGDRAFYGNEEAEALSLIAPPEGVCSEQDLKDVEAFEGGFGQARKHDSGELNAEYSESEAGDTLILWDTMIAQLRDNDPELVSLDLFAVDFRIAECEWDKVSLFLTDYPRDWPSRNGTEAWLELSDALSGNTNVLEIMWDDRTQEDSDTDQDDADIKCGLMNKVASAAFVNAIRACSVLSVGYHFLQPGVVMEQVGAKVKPWLVSRALAALAANDPRLKELRIADVWNDRFFDADAEQLCVALHGNTHLQALDGSAVGFQHELSEAGLIRFGAALARTGVVWAHLPDMDHHHQMHNGAYPRHVNPPCFANAIRRLTENDPDLLELSLSILHFDMRWVDDPSLENQWLQPLKTALCGNTFLWKIYIPAAACLSEEGLNTLLVALEASTVEECEVQLLEDDMQDRVDQELTERLERQRASSSSERQLPKHSTACWPAAAHSVVGSWPF